MCVMTGILVVLFKKSSTNHLSVTHARIDLCYRSQLSLVTLSIVMFSSVVSYFVKRR